MQLSGLPSLVCRAISLRGWLPIKLRLKQIKHSRHISFLSRRPTKQDAQPIK